VAALAGVAAVALAVPAMITVGNHTHAGSGHDDGGGGHGDAQMAAASGHDHGSGDSAEAGAGHSEGEEAAAATALPAEPYTGALPVDLGGVPGVTDEQRERAEALVTLTIQELPQFADPEDAYAAGYRSIGDAATGFEHMVRWDLIDDDVIYDPSQPESLVYAVDGAGGRTLEAAMFMLPSSEDIETAETPFGDLAQLHVHDNLCYAGREGEWRVRAVVEPEYDCPDGSFRFERPAPMVHVWIVGHRCGPFAALEGVGAGQIAEGDPRACDHAHGA
jgi:hypothetical protein